MTRNYNGGPAAAHVPTRYFGTPLKRLEDPRLLRGQATFVDDLRLAGVRHVAFVRSIHPHARFRADVSSALTVPGVVGVFTATDFSPGSGFREIPAMIDHRRCVRADRRRWRRTRSATSASRSPPWSP